MSVLIIGKFKGDTDVFRKALTERADEFEKLGATARPAGAIHHRFGVGDGFVVIVDEWESPQQFEQFIAQPNMQALIAEMGASGPPEMTICEAVASPDEF